VALLLTTVTNNQHLLFPMTVTPSQGGIMEVLLQDLVSCPLVQLLIQPDGTIAMLSSQDKILHGGFFSPGSSSSSCCPMPEALAQAAAAAGEMHVVIVDLIVQVAAALGQHRYALQINCLGGDAGPAAIGCCICTCDIDVTGAVLTWKESVLATDPGIVPFHVCRKSCLYSRDAGLLPTGIPVHSY
jgi:hypothetical protein